MRSKLFLGTKPDTDGKVFLAIYSLYSEDVAFVGQELNIGIF